MIMKIFLKYALNKEKFWQIQLKKNRLNLVMSAMVIPLYCMNHPKVELYLFLFSFLILIHRG